MRLPKSISTLTACVLYAVHLHFPCVCASAVCVCALCVRANVLNERKPPLLGTAQAHTHAHTCTLLLVSGTDSPNNRVRLPRTGKNGPQRPRPDPGGKGLVWLIIFIITPSSPTNGGVSFPPLSLSTHYKHTSLYGAFGTGRLSEPLIRDRDFWRAVIWSAKACAGVEVSGVRG